MPNVAISPPGKFSSILATGAPLVAGRLYTYLAGTTTPQATYTDYTGTIANANPVILDARGEANVWLEQGVAYKYILKDALDNTIWSQDGINFSGLSAIAQSFADGSVAAPSISFANSLGTGFYRVGADILGVSTAGAQAMQINASQNVGIGIAPTAKLDVNGTALVRGNTTVQGGLTVSTGGIAVTAGGINVVAGGAAFAGNTSVTGGTFVSRGFADNATAAAWNIDASGRLLNNGTAQPSFAAFRATSQQTSGTTLIYNTEQFDRGGNYNNGTGVFTAPVAGVYIFSASGQFINFTGASVGFQMRITASSAGDLVSTSTLMPNGTTYASTISVVVLLNAAETVQVTLNASLNALFVLDTANFSRFSGALLY
jgi:hypothetical protein